MNTPTITDDELIALRKATPAGPADVPWSDSLAYARAVLALAEQRHAAKVAELEAELEAHRLYARALCKAVDAATDFAGTVAGGASWWDDVWADHTAALDRALERISQAQAAQPAQVAAPTQAEGWQLVPVEATAPMLTALWNRRDMQSPAELGEAYRAMLAAAPKEPT